MPEGFSSVRKDVFTGALVAVSETRANRPVMRHEDKNKSHCPFCPGNEHLTPNYDSGFDENWQARVFPNKYPVLDGDLGIHDIVVDTRSHDDEIKDFTASELEAALLLLQKTYIEHSERDEGIVYTQIFKNKGQKAGASQAHSHWQVLSGKETPLMQRLLAQSLEQHRDKTGACLYCETLHGELAKKRRVVLENERFAVFVPYASRFVYETWLVPKKHVSAFSELDREDLRCLSDALIKTAAALDKIRASIDYNILFMDSPKTPEIERGLFHWHVQILPRMGGLAGYEFSTAGYINHVAPEKAAEAIREKIREEA